MRTAINNNNQVITPHCREHYSCSQRMTHASLGGEKSFSNSTKAAGLSTAFLYRDEAFRASGHLSQKCDTETRGCRIIAVEHLNINPEVVAGRKGAAPVSARTPD